MSKDFEIFKKEFTKWQIRFGLTGYRVYFSYEPIGDSFADIEINQGNMVATASLNSRTTDINKPGKDIKEAAKHEAVHLLIGRLANNGRYRYTSENEMYEATEELVNKLEGLIPD